MRPRLVVGVLLAIVAFALLPASAGAAAPQASLNEIEGEVMCPVCGTLLELAESPQAQREKAFINSMLARGASKEQIKDALVAEYGEEVLALPDGEGFNLSAYLVPIVAFVIAAIALGFGIARWRRAGDGPGGDGPTPKGPSAADSERLDADLARYDL